MKARIFGGKEDTKFWADNPNTMNQLINKVAGYSKKQRIIRLIEISVKGENTNAFETLEYSMIQSIRESNGECNEVRQTTTHNTPNTYP